MGKKKGQGHRFDALHGFSYGPVCTVDRKRNAWVRRHPGRRQPSQYRAVDASGQPTGDQNNDQQQNGMSGFPGMNDFYQQAAQSMDGPSSSQWGPSAPQAPFYNPPPGASGQGPSFPQGQPLAQYFNPGPGGPFYGPPPAPGQSFSQGPFFTLPPGAMPSVMDPPTKAKRLMQQIPPRPPLDGGPAWGPYRIQRPGGAGMAGGIPGMQFGAGGAGGMPGMPPGGGAGPGSFFGGGGM